MSHYIPYESVLLWGLPWWSASRLGIAVMVAIILWVTLREWKNL